MSSLQMETTLAVLGQRRRYGEETWMRILIIIAITIFSAVTAVADDLSPHQQLIDACYRLNQFRVVKLLREGVDVNTTFGRKHQTLHYGTEWTPLLAVAKSPHHAPIATTGSTQQRAAKRLAILRVLISNNCDLDKCDATGATALHISIRNHDSEFANLLLLFNPNVNTWATREYWERESPLHSAYWSPDLTAALLSHGANAEITDEYRLAAAKADYFHSLVGFIKSNGRIPTDSEKLQLGFNPNFNDIMTPHERLIEQVSAYLKAGDAP